MEKEKTENLIKIMQAFLEGETVEERVVLLDNRTAGWVTHTGNDWNTTKYEYRIKPKPQYRPFKVGIEPTETYSVYVFLPINRSLLVKITKEVLCLDLKEAKNLADNVCKTTGSIKNLSKKVAHELAVNINEHGGRAYIKEE